MISIYSPGFILCLSSFPEVEKPCMDLKNNISKERGKQLCFPSRMKSDEVCGRSETWLEFALQCWIIPQQNSSCNCQKLSSFGSTTAFSLFPIVLAMFLASQRKCVWMHTHHILQLLMTWKEVNFWWHRRNLDHIKPLVWMLQELIYPVPSPHFIYRPVSIYEYSPIWKLLQEMQCSVRSLFSYFPQSEQSDSIFHLHWF